MSRKASPKKVKLPNLEGLRGSINSLSMWREKKNADCKHSFNWLNRVSGALYQIYVLYVLSNSNKPARYL